MRSLIFLFALGIYLFTADHVSAQTTCNYTSNRTLGLGSRGVDVSVLQNILNDSLSDGASPLAVSGYYGSKTRLRVIEYQKKFLGISVSNSYGIVGPRTRDHLKKSCALAATSVQLKNSSSGAQGETPHGVRVTQQHISEGLLPPGALRVPFNKVAITSTNEAVSVSKIKIVRAGVAADGIFESIVILDHEGNPISDEKILTANHDAVIPVDLTINAGSEVIVMVAGNISSELTDFRGQRPELHIQSIESTSQIDTPFPLLGTTHLVVDSLSIGSLDASLAGEDPSSDRTMYIHDPRTIFSAIRLTARSAEDIILTSISWEQNGTASSEDITDVEIVIEGQNFATTKNGREYSADVGEIKIQKGRSIVAQIRGAFTGTGSARTVKFDIAGSDAIVARGSSYKFLVPTQASSNTSTSGNSVFLTSDGTSDGDALEPFFSGSLVTINPGSFNSISK
ncbi:MAG: peptidoglycan-binding domain-containing protein [Minisyncoccia bacterium]